ncbi:HAD family hydrolase [Aquincola tertiaricarbonis]|uniref:HAD family hydrolase n=1 Tax=Aquincola tertiaricarbonis TaxID=391953 RepID=UPI0006150E49|nr:HAD family phosphatase [Aquincola tertiaricarbonis]
MPPGLALFDLDHTLIPFDSGMAWISFLAGQGALPPEAPGDHLACCQRFVAGQADIHDLHRATVAPLAGFAPRQLQACLQRFEADMATRLPPDMKDLVAGHRAKGHLCLLVTATSAIVAEPFGRLFGLHEVVATRPRLTATGLPDGGIDGLPCHREHKPAHVAAALARRGLSLGAFEHSWFYSDSASDLPLLQAVSHPVAVRPDAALRSEARSRGWPVIGQRAAVPPPV